jgi:hypothetical protein
MAWVIPSDPYVTRHESVDPRDRDLELDRGLSFTTEELLAFMGE